MNDEDSIARNRPRRGTRKEVKKPEKKDEKNKEAIATIDSTQSETPVVKRKHVYDSLEHCRALDSTKQKKGVKAANVVPDDEEDNATEDTTEYIRSLSSGSKSRSISERYHDTSLDGKPTNLKITTWNINGLRNWLAKRSGLNFIANDDADIYCFQEIKCGNNKIPLEIKTIPGYFTYWNGSDDGHSGVVCFTKKAAKSVKNGIGIEEYDQEARTITMEFDKFILVNAYVPNSGRGLVRYDFRMKWDEDFSNYLKGLESQKPLIVCGDLNVSHHEIDIANPKSNLKTAGFTIGERDNFSRLLDNVNLIDVFRYLNPTKAEAYTFWTYMRNAREKNIGWRLDYFLLSKRWTKKICDCIIGSDTYGSDHCPVSLYLAL